MSEVEALLETLQHFPKKTRTYVLRTGRDDDKTDEESLFKHPVEEKSVRRDQQQRNNGVRLGFHRTAKEFQKRNIH